jgi:hypothetical protein
MENFKMLGLLCPPVGTVSHQREIEACTVYGRYAKKNCTEPVCSTLGGKMFARFSFDTPDVCVCSRACVVWEIIFC